MSRKNNLEQKALKMIYKAGENGILQSDMWKNLGGTSREGSRLALKFEEKGIIERRKVLHKGRWTYKLFSLKKTVTLKSINSCPCMVCEELEKCYPGGETSPINCNLLTDWITASYSLE